MNIYKAIEELTPDNDPKAFLSALNLQDGWELLDKLPFDRSDKTRALKYGARLFDPNSELHTVSDRLKAKKEELKKLGVDFKDAVWADIVIGKHKEFNAFLGWYLEFVAADEPLRKALVMVKELMHNQMTEAMTYPEEKFVDQKGATQDLPEEKRLKNMSYKQDCAERYIDNIARCEDLERKIAAKYEKADENFSKEISKDMLNNSGFVESFAAKKAQDKK